jgi:hypothetical protein
MRAHKNCPFLGKLSGAGEQMWLHELLDYCEPSGSAIVSSLALDKMGNILYATGTRNPAPFLFCCSHVNIPRLILVDNALGNGFTTRILIIDAAVSQQDVLVLQASRPWPLRRSNIATHSNGDLILAGSVNPSECTVQNPLPFPNQIEPCNGQSMVFVARFSVVNLDTPVWLHMIGEPGQSYFTPQFSRGLAIDGDSIYVGGDSRFTFLQKYDTSGAPLWQRKFNEIDGDVNGDNIGNIAVDPSSHWVWSANPSL